MNGLEGISYLLKFVSEESHADHLISGHLYTYPAGYYHDLEQGRGDEYEASVLGKPLDHINDSFSSIRMYKCANYPIFCMYAVSRSDVENGIINNISRDCIDDFTGRNGFVVVVKYDDMMEIVNDLRKRNSFDINYGMVSYKSLTDEDEEHALRTNSVEHLFVKRPWYRYQNEFRIVFCDDQRKIEIESLEKEGKANARIKYNPENYTFSFDIRYRAEKYPISNFIKAENGRYSLNLSNQ